MQPPYPWSTVAQRDYKTWACVDCPSAGRLPLTDEADAIEHARLTGHGVSIVTVHAKAIQGMKC